MDDWVGRSPGGAGESLACAEALGEDSEMGREGPARVWLPHLNTRPALGADAELLQSMLESLRETERIRAFKAAGGAREHLCFRKLLVEWIIDVCADFKLSMGTAALAVTYTDNVLMLVSVPPTSLQLVAMACILVAGASPAQPAPALVAIRTARSPGRAGGNSSQTPPHSTRARAVDSAWALRRAA